MRSMLSLTPCLLALTACMSSPPQPPEVDESLKRPANAGVAVELQVCKSELQNTRILADECARRAEVASATLAQMSAHQQAIAAMFAKAAASAAAPASAPASPPADMAANRIYTLHFAFGSTKVALPAGDAAALVQQARSAPLVLLRGRTDGSADTPAESRVARGRAEAVKAFLVDAGVDPARIRATYQPAGDHAADNADPEGRSINRRVEIELYRFKPVNAGIAAAAAARMTH